MVESWFDSVMKNQEEKKVETPMVATAALSRAASRGRAFSTARAFGTSARAEMSAVSAAAVKELRDKSGAGMMLCKKALTECNGDMEEAVKWLRKKGMASADKKAGRVAAEGAIHSYIHGGSRLGVLVEVNCETDFVARGDKFKELVADIAMQVAASPGVAYVSPEDADPAMVAAEKELMMKMEDVVSKPENIREDHPGPPQQGCEREGAPQAALHQGSVQDGRTTHQGGHRGDWREDLRPPFRQVQPR